MEHFGFSRINVLGIISPNIKIVNDIIIIICHELKILYCKKMTVAKEVVKIFAIVFPTKIAVRCFSLFSRNLILNVEPRTPLDCHICNCIGFAEINAISEPLK